MAYTMKVDGMEEISEKLTQLAERAPAVASGALYEGAGIMADEVAKAADSINTKPFHYAVFITRDPSPEEKAVVMAGGGAGIAKFQKNGSEVTTSVGYGRQGYAELNGKQVPIAKIANAINSGTSFMRKQPFIRKAANSGSGKALEKMRQSIESAFDEINK